MTDDKTCRHGSTSEKHGGGKQIERPCQKPDNESGEDRQRGQRPKIRKFERGDWFHLETTARGKQRTGNQTKTWGGENRAFKDHSPTMPGTKRGLIEEGKWQTRKGGKHSSHSVPVKAGG